MIHGGHPTGAVSLVSPWRMTPAVPGCRFSKNGCNRGKFDHAAVDGVPVSVMSNRFHMLVYNLPVIVCHHTATHNAAPAEPTLDCQGLNNLSTSNTPSAAGRHHRMCPAATLVCPHRGLTETESETLGVGRGLVERLVLLGGLVTSHIPHDLDKPVPARRLL